MRRILPVLIIMLAIAATAQAQGKSVEAINSQIKSLKAEKSLWTQYDKASNITKVLAYATDFGKEQDGANNLSQLNFGMTYFFVGNQTAAPDSFTTTFWAEGKKSTFADFNALTIIVDGETIDVGNARYARKNGDPREFLNYAISRRTVEKIVKGKDVQLKIGKANLKFKPEHITLFNNLLAVSDPSR